MSWLKRYIRSLRFVFLGLLLLAIIGPWGYERISVPAQYPCHPPNVRLAGDFCGAPVSGAYIIFAVVGAFASGMVGLFTGSTAIFDFRSLFIMIVLISVFLLPIVSTILLSWHEDQQRWQVFHIAAWCLAGSAGVFSFLSINPEMVELHWGSVAYIALAAGALILEILTHMGRRTPSINATL